MGFLYAVTFACLLVVAVQTKSIRYGETVLFDTKDMDIPDSLVELSTEDGAEISDLDIASMIDNLDLSNGEDLNRLIDTMVSLEGLEGAKCSCRHKHCDCCASFKIKIRWVKTWHFNICTSIKLLTTNNMGVYLEVKVNNHRVYGKEISIRNPPAICFSKIPGISKLGNLCLQFYDVDIGQKRACVKVVVKVWKVKKGFNLFCFRLPFVDQEDMIDYDMPREYDF